MVKTCCNLLITSLNYFREGSLLSAHLAVGTPATCAKGIALKKSAQHRFPETLISCTCAAVLLAACGGCGDTGSPSSGAAANNNTALSTEADTARTRAEIGPTGTSTDINASSVQPLSTMVEAGVTTVATATTPTTTTDTLPASTTCGLPNFQQEMLRLINEARAASRSCGATPYQPAKPLAWNAKLFNAAAGHSTDMATNNYFSHTSRDGRTASQRVTAAGYVWRATGENIAAGQRTIQEVMQGWINSPGHCANIMNPAFTEVGVACALNSTSTYKQYWTMNLAAPR